MILSKQNKFVFVKGKKVAGTSLEVMLSSICGPEDIITPITLVDEQYRVMSGQRAAQNYGVDEKENKNYLAMLRNADKEQLKEIRIPVGKYYNHMPFTEIPELNGEVSDGWTVFAAERSPYRKIISFANMQISFNKYQRGRATMRSDIKDLKKHLGTVIENSTIEKVRNIGLYKDKTGKMVADILRFETLAEDVDKLMQSLGITGYPQLKHFKKGVSSNDLDLRDFLSRRQIQVINDLFHEEFECFGYRMIE